MVGETSGAAMADSLKLHFEVVDPEVIAELVKYGLSRETGLRALTLAPAEMLGVDKRAGSLDAGKDADFILLSGDPLSPQSRVKEVYINGRPVFPAE